MRALPPLNALRAFEAAARHQSFSRAADELGVSHSAISRHVRGLEERLGVRLFRDAARGVALTLEGARYLARVGPAFDVIASATERLTDAPEGRVVLNSEPLFAAKVVAPLLAELSSKLPQVDLQLVASTELADLERFEADIAIRFAHRGIMDAPADVLSTAKIYPYAAPGLLRDNRLRPQDLRTLPRLRDRREDLWSTWATEVGWTDLDLEEEPYRLRAPLAIEAALHGAGIFLAASDATAQDVAAGRLVRLSNVGISSGAFYLLSGASSARRKAVRAVRSFLLEHTEQFRDEKLNQMVE